jgi:NADPH:quinone reductase-like Zn-dependent oxidoreductase/NAD(P)-dependent dehydrogenase (short-subunit alcohol dehydrogenase family)/aryl carrier-like protein
MNANIIAKPAVSFAYPKRITLLSGFQPQPLEQETESFLRKAGYDVDHCHFGEEPPAGQDLISFIDLTKPILQDISEADPQRFLEIVGSLQQSLVLWLTPPAQINCMDPHAAQMLGMARTIRAELAVPFATLELDTTQGGAANSIVEVMLKIQRNRDVDSELEPDLEYAYTDGKIALSRFHWIPTVEVLANSEKSSDAKRLEVGKRGLFETLQWTGQKFHELGPDEVEVKMVTVGMNFTDIVIAMGLINSSEVLGEGQNTLGLEGGGYVVKAGSNVKHVQVGDRVMLMGTNSTGLATMVQRPAEYCVKISDSLSFEDAATMPVLYVTVLRCFLDKANLQKGQSVLIHSAAGGVGIAAMHTAKWIGAEIYATVGSEENADFINKKFGIPRNRIFSSRNTSFLDGIKAITNGKGVDVVLNSLSGELLHASWKCVAANGCMLEIGKRDMIGKGQIALDKFEENRTFYGVDLSRLTVLDRTCVARLMGQTIDLYNKGHIKPVHPITTFDAEQIEEAFRYMQKGIHMGKIVIRFPEEDILPLTHTVSAPAFRGDASYLLVGGLGGLGKSIASWMAFHGATNIIFLSRSAGKSTEDQEFFNELKMAGCSVQCYPGDIADVALVQKVIKEARKPISGVMQMAMVLRDVGVMDMDQKTWEAAVRPKVQGTWNLHNALPDNLDFFVLFSSYAGVMGFYGQSNYASANTFLDAFVQYRQNRGLAATVMDIGVVEDVGFVSRTQNVLDSLKATSARLITEKEFLDYLQLAINLSRPSNTQTQTSLAGFCNRAQIIHGMECSLPITDPQNNVIWKRDPRMAIYRNIKTAGSSHVGETVDALRQFLASATADPKILDQSDSTELFAQEIAKRVSTFLMKDDIEVSQTLNAVGVDSLVAIELRNWWKQNFGVETSFLELMNGGTIQQLGELAAKRLKEKFAGSKA